MKYDDERQRFHALETTRWIGRTVLCGVGIVTAFAMATSAWQLATVGAFIWCLTVAMRQHYLTGTCRAGHDCGRGTGGHDWENQ